MELVQIYLKITNFLAFLLFFPFNFSLLDSDPGGKINGVEKTKKIDQNLKKKHGAGPNLI